MLKKRLKRILVVGLAAGLGFAGITACEAPEEAEEPTAQAEAADDEAQDQADEAPALDQQEAPDELGGPPEGGDQPPMPMGGQDFDEEVTDEELDQFGEAIEAMQELQEEGEDPQQRMQEADGQAEMQQIQQELMQEMQTAVEESGMEFQDFMMMAQRLQQDPELQQRLAERVDMEELMGPGPEGPGAQQPAPGGQQPSPVEQQAEDGDEDGDY